MYGDNWRTISRGNKDYRRCGGQPEWYQSSDHGYGSPSDPDSSGDGDDTSSGDGDDDEDEAHREANSDHREQGECTSVSNRLNRIRVKRSNIRHGRANVFRAPPVKIPTFDGYHESYENCFTILGFGIDQKLQCLHKYLTGEARQFYRGLSEGVKSDYFRLIVTLHWKFCVEWKDPDTVYGSLRIKKGKMSVTDLLSQIV